MRTSGNIWNLATAFSPRCRILVRGVSMTQFRVSVLLALCLMMSSVHALRADVRADQRTRFQFAGMFGKVVNLFGGKSAREGVTSTVAIKGNRKLTRTDTTGQIIDLDEEKIYDIDLKKKSYKVTTFAELRREMEEAQKKAAEDARKAQREEGGGASQSPSSNEAPQEVEVDFDVKNTGQTKTISGFNTRQAIMTVTVREKGKTLEQGGGLVMTTDMWLAPRIAALNEIGEFDAKYFQKLYGPVMAGASAQDMAAAMALYPMMKPAIEKMSAETGKLEGTAITTTVTMDAVKPADQVAEEQKSDDDSKASAPRTVGGLLGGFARKIQKKDDEAPKARATFMTTSHEVLKVATDVTAEELAIPAGFKENK